MKNGTNGIIDMPEDNNEENFEHLEQNENEQEE